MIIYLLRGHPLSGRWEQDCYEHVEDRGYVLDSLIGDDAGDGDRPGFASALKMLIEGRADVMVVGSADYLPGDWVPRIELAGASEDAPWAIPPENRPAVPRQRRPRPRDAGRGRQL